MIPKKHNLLKQIYKTRKKYLIAKCKRWGPKKDGINFSGGVDAEDISKIDLDDGVGYNRGEGAEGSVSGKNTANKSTFKSSKDIPVDANGYTKSNLKLCREAHRKYKVNEALNGIVEKEYRLPSGKRVDAIEIKNGVIYEIKPNNPKSIKAREKQLQGYLDELNNIGYLGKKWTGVLDTY